MSDARAPLTLFACPKAFTGIFNDIQRNALTSWTQLQPRPSILLLGDDPGVREAAEEFGCGHIPSIATSERGIPLLSDIFKQAQATADTRAMCFVNADIVLTSETTMAAEKVTEWSDRFLLVARRSDVDSVPQSDLARPDWEERIKAIASTGRLRSDGAIDWFLFARGQFADIPPFMIGRTGYDNWLLWKAVNAGYPLVDATRFVPLVHQRHDYSTGGGASNVWYGPEALANRQMVGHWSRYFVISHATWMMTSRGDVVPARGLRYRLARPKRRVSHVLRFTRRLRTLIEYGSGGNATEA